MDAFGISDRSPPGFWRQQLANGRVRVLEHFGDGRRGALRLGAHCPNAAHAICRTLASLSLSKSARAGAAGRTTFARASAANRRTFSSSSFSNLAGQEWPSSPRGLFVRGPQRRQAEPSDIILEAFDRGRNGGLRLAPYFPRALAALNRISVSLSLSNCVRAGMRLRLLALQLLDGPKWRRDDISCPGAVP